MPRCRAAGRDLSNAGPHREECGADTAGKEGEKGEEEDSQASELDPFEMPDPADILSKMEKDLFKKVI